MKYRTTAKAVRENHYKVIKIGYCDLQDLLHFETPVAYTCGVYGWNADIYEVAPGVCICTGYRPTGAAPRSYAAVRAYNDKARRIVNSTSDYELRRGAVRTLLDEFVRAAC